MSVWEQLGGVRSDEDSDRKSASVGEVMGGGRHV